MRIRLIGLLALAAAFAAASSARAADAAGCSEFMWPLATEIAWFEADASEKVASGATLAALPEGKAIELALEPAAKATLPVKPTSTPKAEDAEKFVGAVTIEGFPQPGAYQVAISASGWIDVVQNGTPLESIAHTGSPNCDVLRKSVRYEVGAGPVSIQVSSVPKDTIRIAVRPAAD